LKKKNMSRRFFGGKGKKISIEPRPIKEGSQKKNGQVSRLIRSPMARQRRERVQFQWEEEISGRTPHSRFEKEQTHGQKRATVKFGKRVARKIRRHQQTGSPESRGVPLKGNSDHPGKSLSDTGHPGGDHKTKR